jgi:hypothetical protein
MNLQILAMWVTLASAGVGLILILAWLVTGRKHTALRVAGGICVVIMGLSFLYGRFAA